MAHEIMTAFQIARLSLKLHRIAFELDHDRERMQSAEQPGFGQLAEIVSSLRRLSADLFELARIKRNDD